VKPLGYRPALDGVRGLAITSVVALHATGWPRDGSLGVDLFFVLSGFLITTLLLQERAASGTISFRAFYRRRAARLLPGLFLMLGVYMIATRGAHALAVLFAVTYTTNIASVIDPGIVPFSLGHLWSLAQEEQFYLLWPPLLFLIIRVRPTLLTRIIGLLILAVVVEKLALLATGAGLDRIYLAPDTHADPILVGCLFGALFTAGSAPKLGRFGPVALVGVVGLVVSAQWLPFLHAANPLRTIFAIASGFLVLAAVEGSRPLAIRPLVFLGQISYSLYLVHVPILIAMQAAVGGGHPWRTGPAVVAAIAAASASFYFVERPLRRRLRQSRGEPVFARAPAPAST
jgi:peptidoglycan/LPS O-acetylase OafA/YrhL